MTPQDPAATAGLVTRQVRTGTRDGTLTRVAVARRTYATDQADLWNAVTDPERLRRWFSPVTGDLAEGGHYQVQGNAGGTVLRCDPPRSFSLTWEFGPMTSWVTVNVAEDDDGARLELLHEAPVDPDMWEMFGPGAVGVGWDLSLMGLGMHLESGASVDHDDAEAWAISPNGVEVTRQFAGAWADAAVADGDDHDLAHEAAARTVAFFTTPPDPAATSGDDDAAPAAT